MYETARRIFLYLSLSLLGKDIANCVEDDGRLLKVLEISNRTVQHNQPNLENINRALNVQINGLIESCLHEFRMRAIEIE